MNKIVVTDEENGVTFSKRSILYGLEPLGRGTAQVECLSSYICRLAYTHNVTVGSLFKVYIYPRMKTYPFLKKSCSKSHMKLLEGSMVNGTGNIAGDLIDIIELLTSREDLNEISLLNWTSILNKSVGIINPKKRWCPNCFNDWSRDKKPIYEPLLWHLKRINTCSVHKVLLQDTCYKCHKSPPYFTAKIQIGFCPYCSTFLGREYIEDNQISLTDSEKYYISGFSELLIMNSSINACPTSYSVKNFFDNFKKANKKISFKGLAKNLNAFNGERISTWFTGRHRPPLEFWSRISEIMNTSIYSLLIKTNNYNVLNPYFQNNYRKKNESWLDKEEIRNVLMDYINKGENSLSAKGVFKLLGLNSKSVEYHFPELVSIIVKGNKMYKDQKKENNIQKIKAQLENILKDSTMNRFSLKQILDKVGISYKIAKKWAPQLCHEIVKRNRVYKLEIKYERVEKEKANIRKIIYNLHEQGIYPSDTIICNTFSRAALFKNKYYRDFRIEVRKELGYKN